MKRHLLIRLFGFLPWFAAAHAQVVPDGFYPLFNGKDLMGCIMSGGKEAIAREKSNCAQE